MFLLAILKSRFWAKVFYRLADGNCFPFKGAKISVPEYLTKKVKNNS